MARMRIVRRRPLVEALVAESGARRRAQDRGEDPDDQRSEALAAAAQANLAWMLRQRVSDAPEDQMSGFADALID
ncbi:Uncharacterised protein [Mycobacteroides abscessus subsp. abscessus]|uniref:hypothetical protein n=2 Tax=Mycobacteroides abscessus TaxID=36809 RepID=UPI0009268FE1|nr:hypothetical protein [Mycobacteroides abscessus]SHP82531.1 Uncharacterised protein [Mycobacteroides abscessus subsp. abscessus]SHQ13385.1 Uncharacterised protein [Mycobacteroides abscessus subsp. abscessus]SHQ26272.1 Uncharacterised protein [Mycobacteroides abscessus subsp. abscessus]SHQ44495.1 Uncharacterised protein [Mycobacteroides abscessus subsp. abscessus]SHV52134.1 Uncharacterised protein [Mycobacteroides abscessus subsp. abscessus]